MLFAYVPIFCPLLILFPVVLVWAVLAGREQYRPGAASRRPRGVWLAAFAVGWLALAAGWFVLAAITTRNGAVGPYSR